MALARQDLAASFRVIAARMTGIPPKRRKTPRRIGAIFLVPGLIAALTGAGLLSALIGDGAWDAVSWLALSVPVAVAAWFVYRPH